MITIYHNPQCSKSRAALAVLESSKQKYVVQEYLIQSFTVDELKQIISLLNITPLALIRKSEPIFIERFLDKDYTDDEWLTIMVEYPILIERPIVIKNGRATIGRPVENIVELLASK
ncbi:arsenate reductase (glutaredoxin) [Sphingobacterium rhinopitheci]|uniref:arsenate reductase (glutaredoxin) n=1 Tax=Sphingobacterium rhinopitheci TaxID=2781960 RepID=UPI001F52AD83|nr:arsenate reductase (glutaredoxin) [Sphingobacterium rhinopitheci]MCI0921939.1 arsenate reductase (glutaredoxin) [Sphingobacterium rhinopitheci]